MVEILISFNRALAEAQGYVKVFNFKTCLSLMLESISFSAFAVDTYSNGQLSIPLLTFGPTTYTNVVVTVGSVVSIGSGNQNGSIDNYDSATGQLTIPSVMVRSTTYNNVVVTISGVVSIGASYNTTQNNSTAATSAVITVGM